MELATSASLGILLVIRGEKPEICLRISGTTSGHSEKDGEQYMGLYTEKILPHLINHFMAQSDFSRLRGEVLEAVSGRVLEIGFGTGLNLPHYSATVAELIAVDPCSRCLQLADDRIRSAPFPVRIISADETGARIDLPDDSMDAVVSTWSLCTIPDAVQALRECRRILKADGRLHFVEHGRSPESGVARWQDRLTPMQKIIGGGCHLNRPIAGLIESAGFRIENLRTFYNSPVKVGSYMYAGTARP
ncbi:MAG: class I SAM-dependent methyltransferase [Leptospiraceae bacterium]|nr:class I SAM-dependent methyltransferase [Leptospiraceae bacterium]